LSVFVSDTFTDSNGTLLQNHTPETGGSWQVRAGSGDNANTIQSNECAGTGGFWYTNAATPGNVEYTTTGDFTTPTDAAFEYFYLFARFIDASNFYFAYYYSGDLNLYKKVSGSNTQLDTLSEAWGTSSAEAKLEILDATKKFYKDSVEKLTSADNAITAAGNAGFICKTPFTLDNFVADDTGAAEAENASMQPMHHWWPR
jgi:hypothetical protein